MYRIVVIALLLGAAGTACGKGQDGEAPGWTTENETDDLGATEAPSDTQGGSAWETQSDNSTLTSDSGSASVDTSTQGPTDTQGSTDTSSALQDNDSDGWVDHEGMDCNDSDPAVNPGMPEVEGNGLDDDCDGKVDEAGVVDTQACDGQAFAIEFMPTNLMILLDMSGSMVDTPPKPTKWEQARAALTTLLTDWDGVINFGLDIFPDDHSCGVDGGVTRDVARRNGGNIVSYLNNAPKPEGATPLCMALRKMSDTSYSPGLFNGTASSYLVVVSDGEDTCGGPRGICRSNRWFTPNEPTVEQLAERTTDLLHLGLRTFVIGFGDGVSPSQLNAIAGAGGTSFNTYLDASDQTELHGALGSIVSSIASCSFELRDPNASADPDKVNFFFDGTPVPYDADCAAGDGWKWNDDSHSAITFCANACKKLSEGEVATVSAEFGCEQVAN